MGEVSKSNNKFYPDIVFDVNPKTLWHITDNAAIHISPTFYINQAHHFDSGETAVVQVLKLENENQPKKYTKTIDKLKEVQGLSRISQIYCYESHLWIFSGCAEDISAQERSLNDSNKSSSLEFRVIPTNTSARIIHVSLAIALLAILFSLVIVLRLQSTNTKILTTTDYMQEIEKKLKLSQMSDIKKNTIEAAVDSMSKEAGVLLLLGMSKDTNCSRSLHTAYCFGREFVRTINTVKVAGANQNQAYIDGSKGYKLINESMYTAFVDKTYPSILIDNIESMSGDAALVFMQIDPDVKMFRQHLVVLMAYVDPVLLHEENVSKLAEENVYEFAEKLLESKWSKSLSDDKLGAVISRITTNIVKI